MSDEKIITILESAMLVEKGVKSTRYFNEALLNHIIQFESEEADDSDIETERLIYRVIVEEVRRG